MTAFTVQRLITALTCAITLCGIIPLFPYLQILPKTVFLATFCLGIWWDRTEYWPIRPWLLTTAATISLLWYAGQFSRANPAQPVVSGLVILLSVRLVTEKSPRHHLQIYAIALFCLASSSLFDLSPVFLAWLTAMLLMIALALMLVTFHSHDRRMTLSPSRLRTVVAFGLALPIASLPLLVAYFPILPRTQRPLWNFLNPQTAAGSALSERVAPGSAASVGEGTSLAFRAETAKLATPQPYWRAVVFNILDGSSWRRDPNPPAEERGELVADHPQTIFLEPGGSRFLIGLDLPVKFLPFRGKRAPDHAYELATPPSRRTSYEVRSALVDAIPVTRLSDRDYYLRLPPDIPPRTRELAASVRSTARSDSGRIVALSNWFRAGNFSYSRSNLPTGRDSLETFLFKQRKGHCEFFASSFATILRAAGVPARLVGGYLGGDYNELGGYYLVTGNMAHVWVEAFVEGTGWLRIDPSAMAVNADSFWGKNRPRSATLRLRLMMDYLDHYWNRSVINYDFESQVGIVREVNRRFRGIDAAGIWKKLQTAGIAVALVVVGCLIARNMRFGGKGREERLLRRFVTQYRRDLGETIDPSREGLTAIALRTGNRQVREFVEIYTGAVYRDRQLTTDEYKSLKELLRQGFKQAAGKKKGLQHKP